MKKLLCLTLVFVGAILISCDTHELDDPGLLVPLTAEEDSSVPSISVNGTLLHSETFGDPTDPMVVFLHGGPGADYRNGLNARFLAEHGYYVVFYDQRGTGLSQRHDRDIYNIDIMFDDLSGVIDYYRTSIDQTIILFGHSWGAILATGYINEYPNAIDGVILVEAGGLNDDDLFEYAESSRKLKVFSEEVNDILYVDQFITGEEHAILDYKFALLSPYSYAEGNDEGIEGFSPFWRFGAVTLDKFSEIADEERYDFTDNLDQYANNVLLLYGELNSSYGLGFAEKEAAFFPNAQIVAIPDTGHEMIHFKWDLVEGPVLNYLNSID